MLQLLRKSSPWSAAQLTNLNVLVRKFKVNEIPVSVRASVGIRAEELEGAQYGGLQYYRAARMLAHFSRTLSTFSPEFLLHELDVKDVRAPLGTLITQVIRYYFRQISFQLYKAVGSADLIGDPVGLLESMGESVISVTRLARAQVMGREPWSTRGVHILFEVQAV
jgi:hypothetical protein